MDMGGGAGSQQGTCRPSRLAWVGGCSLEPKWRRRGRGVQRSPRQMKPGLEKEAPASPSARVPAATHAGQHARAKEGPLSRLQTLVSNLGNQRSVFSNM